MKRNGAVMIVVAFLYFWAGIPTGAWTADSRTVVPGQKIPAPPTAETQKVKPAASQVLPQIIVVSPNDGETWYGGETHDIQWTTFAIPETSRIRIEFVRSDTLKSIIADNLPRSGKFSWNIGQAYFSSTTVSGWLGSTHNVPVDTKGTLRITTSAEGKTYGAERSVSLIVRRIKITSPNAGAVWQAGKTYAITWQNIGPAVPNVRIQIETGWAPPLVYKLVANTGSASITLPAADSTHDYSLWVSADGGNFPENFIRDKVVIKITK